MADGYITIETKLSTNKFDKQVTDLEKKIKNEEEKAQLKLKAKLQAEDEFILADLHIPLPPIPIGDLTVY